MKFIITVFLSVPMFFISLSCLSQSDVSSPSERLAAKQADRLRDSLGLTDNQRQKVYDANISLHNSKSAAWTRYANDRGRLQTELQTIENRRDSLYGIIFGSGDKFLLYKSKKGNIIKSD